MPARSSFTRPASDELPETLAELDRDADRLPQPGTLVASTGGDSTEPGPSARMQPGVPLTGSLEAP